MSSWISASSSPNRNSASVLASSVLPTPDGPAKMNEPPGRLGSFRPARVRRIAWDSALIASLLADDALVQLVLHAQQPGGLLLGQLEDRDAGRRWPGPRRSAPRRPRRRRPCRRPSTPSRAWPSAASSCFSLSRSAAAFSKSCASIADSLSRRTSAIFSSNSRRSGGAVIRRMRIREPASSIRSIALSGRKRSRDVAVGQGGRGHQRAVGDRDPVVRLVPVAQALEDLDGVRQRRLGDLDRLEAALERGVLLQVLAVLVERGGADGLQLAAGQHRLEDRGRVDRALGGTGTDEGVDLVDEQDDVAAGADLLEDLLQPLLEVTAVAAAGHQRAEVERVELLVLQRLRAPRP